jgi:hypothetical protein
VLMARTISQTPSAIGIPRITKTTRTMPDSIILFQLAQRTWLRAVCASLTACGKRQKRCALEAKSGRVHLLAAYQSARRVAQLKKID